MKENYTMLFDLYELTMANGILRMGFRTKSRILICSFAACRMTAALPLWPVLSN